MENNDREIIYIAMKLYNFSDKIQAESLEVVLLKYFNTKTFMPFRDTDENKIVSDNRTKYIYDEDIKRLDSGQVGMILAMYDGICKDEGISFEIGYSYGKGIPIFLINTDFIWYATPKYEFLFDPVVGHMCSDYLHYYQITERGSFLESLSLSQEEGFKIAVEKAKALYQLIPRASSLLVNECVEHDVFIDFGGGRYEYQREYAKWLEEGLSSRGLKVTVANRFYPNNDYDYYDSGRNDIKKLLGADIFVCLGDETEMNSGTGALLGLGRSLEKQIVMYESSNIEIHGENGHRMKKNLMIDFSVDYVARTKKELLDVIINIRGEKHV